MVESGWGQASSERNGDLLLGRLAVRERFCTQAEIDECLQMQKLSDPPAELGDVLLFKGYLTAVQLRDLLGRQHKKVMACGRCRLSFTVLTPNEGKSARCPRCKEGLVETSPQGPARTDAEIATGRFRVSTATVTPPGSGAPKLKLRCVICDAPFEGSPDPSGRVRCPSCQSTFTSRG